MKQDKMAPPGFYLQFFKNDIGEIFHECAAIIRDDYTCIYSRVGYDSWFTLLWSFGPRKNYFKKTALNVKKSYVQWWERFEDLDSLKKRLEECKIVDRGNQSETMKLPDVPIKNVSNK